jgi:hypothetical protein
MYIHTKTKQSKAYNLDNNKKFSKLNYTNHYMQKNGASVVCRGTMLQVSRLQVRFLMRSLDFSIDLILVAAL